MMLSKRKRKLTSPAWEFFDAVEVESREGGRTARCKLCDMEVKTPGGSTTGLVRHLGIYHDGYRGDFGALRRELELMKEEGVTSVVKKRPRAVVPLDKAGPQPSRQLTSPAWEFFDPLVFKETAKCRICDRVIKTTGGGTQGLLRHLQGRHPTHPDDVGGLSDRALGIWEQTGSDDDEDDVGEHSRAKVVVPLDKSGAQPCRQLSSPMWNFFDIIVFRESAKCKICDCVISTWKGTTTGLVRHMRAKHGQNLKAFNSEKKMGMGMKKKKGRSVFPKRGVKMEDEGSDSDLAGETDCEEADEVVNVSQPTKEDNARDPLQTEEEQPVLNPKPKGSKPQRRRRLTSPAWEFFVPVVYKETAKCKICGIVIKTSHGATSGMGRHLASKHGGDLETLRRKLWLKRRAARRPFIPRGVRKVEPSDPDVGHQSQGTSRDSVGLDGEIERDADPGIREEEEEGPLKIEQDVEKVAEKVKSTSQSRSPSKKLKRRRRQSSRVWKYFVPDAKRATAKCKICGGVYKTASGVTTGILNHLRRVHSMLDPTFTLSESWFTKLKAGNPNRDQGLKNGSKLGESTVKAKIVDPVSNSADADAVSQVKGNHDEEIWVEENETSRDGFEMDDPLQSEYEEETMGISEETAGSTADAKQLGKETCFVCHDKFNFQSAPQLSEKEYRFFFNEMLEIPTGRSMAYLDKLEQPEKWIALCHSCQSLIEGSLQARRKIVSLQLQLEKWQREVVSKIKAGSVSGNDYGRSHSHPKKQRLVVEDIQKYVKCKNYSVLEDEVDVDPVDLDSEGPTTPVSVVEEESDADSESEPFQDDAHHSSSQVYYCGLCNDDTIYESTATLSAHTKEAHPKPSTSGPDPGQAHEENEIEMFQPNLPEEERLNELVKVLASASNTFQYRYKCPNCPEVKGCMLIPYILHLAIHKIRPYQCSICAEFLPPDEDLREAHWKEKHSQVQLPPEANKSVHIKFSPGQIYKCASCLEGFHTEEERNLHERRCLPSAKLTKKDLSLSKKHRKIHKCQVCHLTFRHFDEWRFHRALHHPEVDSMSCYYCDQSFSEKTMDGLEARHDKKMADHIQTEHGNMKLLVECEPCGLVFEPGMDATEHMSERHGIPASEAYPCRLCGATYPDVHGMRRHMASFHFERNPSICETCGAKFFTAVSLTHHNFLAHGIIPEGYEVLTCPKEGCSFKSILKGKLNIHISQVHEALEARQFICKFCGKAFKNKVYLRQHEDLHKNRESKPFQCEICGSSFAVKNYLTVHKKLQHEGRKIKYKRRIRSVSNSQNQEETENRVDGPGPDPVMNLLDTMISSSSSSLSTSGAGENHPQTSQPYFNA